MSITRTDRRVITFYSYKGGVGRTMALANVAFRLADLHALDVVVVDWDLEAPGLHEFFEIPREALAAARGVLDYLVEWREAAKRRDPSPPNARSWLIPVEGTPRAPRNGSLSLLIAGRVDDTYDARLSALDWKDFYANASGALAVETLRRQLVEGADVVLVDSRTGLTDAGGICTIQLPDGVVLMTTPNRQSLQGIERIARSIAKVSPRERAGRARVTAWLSVCRMPSAEETSLAEEWFKKHSADFERMVEDGVLDREAHALGLATHAIPQRARWGFDEVLFTEHVSASRSDSLLAAYEHLTVTILDWVVAPFDRASPAGDRSPRELGAAIDALKKRAAAAEARRDGRGQLAALVMQGDALSQAGRPEDAARVLERAADIALGAELREHRAAIKVRLAAVLQDLERHDDAMAEARAALDLARELKSSSIEADALARVGLLTAKRDGYEAAVPYLTQAIAAARALGDVERALALLRVMASGGKLIAFERHYPVFVETLRALTSKLESASRALADKARETGDTFNEIRAIKTLLQLSAEGVALPDVKDLRARLDALEAGEPIPRRSATTTKNRAPSRKRERGSPKPPR